MSRTKTVVSSAHKETLISFSPTLIPFMAGSFLIALASISMPITNNSPDKGQPCLTPRGKIPTQNHYLERNCKLCYVKF